MLSIKINLFILIFVASTTCTLQGAKYISDEKLWSHVITIDRLAWMNHKDQKVSPVVEDELFVRRAYLDITGTIPAYEQTLEFINSKQYSKRTKLIDMLLSSPGYASHYYSLFADMLRIPRNNNLTSFGKLGNDTHEYAIWIKKQLSENTTYDQLVRELLTAQGSILENPASHYYYRDASVFDSVNSTATSLLGRRIGCAQCHNHRFDKWTQKEFYEFAAFFQVKKGKLRGGLPKGKNTVPHGYWSNIKRVWAEDNLESKYSKEQKAEIWKLLIPPTYGPLVEEEDLTYPVDYVYDNASPGEVVKPRIIFEDLQPNLKGETRREQVANWVTSKENRMFSEVMVNRLWKKVFGVGLAEPIDDWKDNTPVINPELMDALTDIFIELNYDFKAFLSILYNTEAYQMSVNGKEQLLMKNYQIQGALLRRMTAEQLWDSMLTLAIGPKSIFKDDVHEKSFEYHDQRRDFMKKYVDDCIDIIQKHKGSEIYKGNVDELKDLVRLYIPKAKQFTEDYRLIESGSIPKLYAETKFPRIIPKGDFVTEMRRASDGGKREDVFVRLFGASDRSQSVHGGSSEANLVQPLELLNGETIREVTSKGSYIMKRIMMEESDKKKLEVLTYSLFSRKPSSQESSILKKHFSSKTQKGKSIVEKWQSYMIASMNSPEFIFIQ